MIKNYRYFIDITSTNSEIWNWSTRQKKIYICWIFFDSHLSDSPTISKTELLIWISNSFCENEDFQGKKDLSRTISDYHKKMEIFYIKIPLYFQFSFRNMQYTSLDVHSWACKLPSHLERLLWELHGASGISAFIFNSFSSLNAINLNLRCFVTGAKHVYFRNSFLLRKIWWLR